MSGEETFFCSAAHQRGRLIKVLRVEHRWTLRGSVGVAQTRFTHMDALHRLEGVIAFYIHQ